MTGVSLGSRSVNLSQRPRAPASARWRFPRTPATARCLQSTERHLILATINNDDDCLMATGYDATGDGLSGRQALDVHQAWHSRRTPSWLTDRSERLKECGQQTNHRSELGDAEQLNYHPPLDCPPSESTELRASRRSDVQHIEFIRHRQINRVRRRWLLRTLLTIALFTFLNPSAAPLHGVIAARHHLCSSSGQWGEWNIAVHLDDETELNVNFGSSQHRSKCCRFVRITQKKI